MAQLGNCIFFDHRKVFTFLVVANLALHKDVILRSIVVLLVCGVVLLHRWRHYVSLSHQLVEDTCVLTVMGNVDVLPGVLDFGGQGRVEKEYFNQMTIILW